MKLFRHCSTVVVLVLVIVFAYMVVVNVSKKPDNSIISESSPHKEKCIRNDKGECIISEDQLSSLLHVVEKNGKKPDRRSSSERVKFGDNTGHMASPEELIHELHTFQMRSDAKNTVFQHGYDTGLSKECLSRDYGDLRGWPKASIVIPFCENELLSDVLHTVHSIIQRSPDQLLQEVILIDDNSKKANFKEVLDNYKNAVFGDKVRVIRSNHTLGLIQGRLLGAREARGDVIITMDAHMEVQETWLEALLYEIRLDRKTMATAMLDWMKPNGTSWIYEKGINSFMCVFTWDLGFGFAYPRKEVRDKMEKDRLAAFPAPCSVGTIWAIEKKFFQEIGELDEGMLLWGGENLDLPIRTWLFGGRAVQVPCSHAAHLERPHQRDYRYGWDKSIQQNYKRVVEVWFDDYKEHVYRMKPELKSIELTDISNRMKLKRRAVHDFQWFLANIYPELGVYNNNSFGYNWLQNIGMKKCLHKVGNEYIMWDCLSQPHKEGIWLTTAGHLRTDLQYWHLKNAVDKNNTNKYVLGPEGATGVYQEDWIVKWIHWKGGPMMAYEKDKGINNNLCMEAYNIEDGSRVGIRTCDPENDFQRWHWKDYTKDYQIFSEKGLHSRFNSHYHKTSIQIRTRKEWR